jgi:hypothetical protein
MWHPTVKIQVKTTVDLREEDDHFVYDLDIETYNWKACLRRRTPPAEWYGYRSAILLTALALSGCLLRTGCALPHPFPKWMHGGCHDRAAPER